MRIRGLAIVAIVALGGCSSTLAQAPAISTSASPSVPPSTSSSEPSPATASAGDVAACKAYLRVEPVANKSIKDLSGLPTPMLAKMFNGWADDLENGTVAASSTELVDAFKGTVAGLRSMAATTTAWKDGSLDLIPDLTVVYQESDKVQAFCSSADPTSTYVAIVNAA